MTYHYDDWTLDPFNLSDEGPHTLHYVNVRLAAARISVPQLVARPGQELKGELIHDLEEKEDKQFRKTRKPHDHDLES